MIKWEADLLIYWHRAAPSPDAFQQNWMCTAGKERHHPPLPIRNPGKICSCGPRLQIKMLHFTFVVLLHVPKGTNPSSLVCLHAIKKAIWTIQAENKTDQTEITLVIYCSQTCSSTESRHYNQQLILVRPPGNLQLQPCLYLSSISLPLPLPHICSSLLLISLLRD